MLLTAIALLLAAAVSGTVAYLAASTGEVVNTFTPTEIGITVEEEVENNVKSNVKIKNTGNIPAYIRAQIIVTWQDKEGHVYAQKPDGEGDDRDYTLTLGNSGWKADTSSGFYYYPDPVAAGGSTGVLIDRCEPGTGSAPEGYYLHVEILAQAIQATPSSVVEGVWPVTVGEKGVLSLKSN